MLRNRVLACFNQSGDDDYDDDDDDDVDDEEECFNQD